MDTSCTVGSSASARLMNLYSQRGSPSRYKILRFASLTTMGRVMVLFARFSSPDSVSMLKVKLFAPAAPAGEKKGSACMRPPAAQGVLRPPLSFYWEGGVEGKRGDLRGGRII